MSVRFLFRTVRSLLPEAPAAAFPAAAARFFTRGKAVLAALLLAIGAVGSAGAETGAQSAGELITRFDQFWKLPPGPDAPWQPVRLELEVYYYDSAWQVLWARCGDGYSHVVLKNGPLTLRPGERILVTGRTRGGTALVVEDAQVQTVAEPVPIEAPPTRGAVGDVERFNKRMVTLEGYVDAAAEKDATHAVLELEVEGRTVTAWVHHLAPLEVAALRDAQVRLKGVYSGRLNGDGTLASLELWVPGAENIQVIGQRDLDDRFAGPEIAIADLAGAGPGRKVRVVGVVEQQEPGRRLAIRDATGLVEVDTVQLLAAKHGELIEVMGEPMRDGAGWRLREGLFRRAPRVITSVDQIYQVRAQDRRVWHRVRMELLVYYYDPYWKAVWGRSGGLDNYMSLGDRPLGLKPGQLVLVEGRVLPVNEMVVEDTKVTVLNEAAPLVPLETQGAIAETARFNKRMATVEGYVDRLLQRDDRHLVMELVVEDRVVTVTLLHEVGVSVSQWEGARLRVTGVYSATMDSAGQISKIEIWVHGAERVEALGWLDQDKDFDLPPTSIERLASLPAGARVRIAGEVREQQEGRSLTVRDATGQVTVPTAQARPLQLGEQVEMIGYAVRGTLEQGLYRRIRSSAAAPALGLPRLRFAKQVRELRPEEATRGYPVQLEGVVTWSQGNADFFYMVDASGGVRVNLPTTGLAVPLLNAKIGITGISAAGEFAPIVVASNLQTAATLDLPAPRQVTLEQVMTGVDEAQWVTMSGYVRDIRTGVPWTVLELTTSAGEFTCLVPPNAGLDGLRGSVVQVRGVCSALANARRQLTGIQLWVPSASDVTVEEAEPADPFSVALRPIASLRQFNTLDALNRRVRVAGVVVDAIPGRLVRVQEGAERVLVLSRATTPLRPGDRIEAVGFPGREGSRIVLREAVYRRVASGAEPAALEINQLSPIDAELDGRLVRVECLLLDLGTREGGARLICQSSEAIFEALLDLEKAAAPGAWAAGSRLALTGVYQIQFDEYKRPQSVRIQLRGPHDVRVLHRPSWWTPQHALGLSGVLGCALVLGFFWVVALRRRVRRQTDLIRTQLENERAARLEAALTRASKLESLGVLAGGIAHDFNNLLTVAIGNLSLAKLDGKLDAETEGWLNESERANLRARDLTQQLLTFAKGGDPIREATMLPDVVRESAEFALHGSKVRCDFDVAGDLWPADVDKGQIGRVVHNLVINANQAMPAGGVIRIVLNNCELAAETLPGVAAGRYLKLSVIDQGPGIAPENLSRIFEPYFTTRRQGHGLGLATVYSVVKKHGGHLEVESVLGHGTTFHIWLPAAQGSLAAATPVKGAVAPQQGRVLFMDDEAPIRLLAAAFLKRLGLEATMVADGEAVVREFTAARAAGRPYDVVILDLTVPGGMGGAEAMTELRAIDPAVRAIVSSGYSSDPVMASYRAHGFRAVVPKPYDIDLLGRTINGVLLGG